MKPKIETRKITCNGCKKTLHVSKEFREEEIFEMYEWQTLGNLWYCATCAEKDLIDSYIDESDP